MSITNRLSLFFLAALGLVLAGFSLTLYLLADHHLHQQTDHRLEAAMQTLVAAIEVHSNDVEWEPLERRVTMGEDAARDQVRWTVHDLRGRLVDCSLNWKGTGESKAEMGWELRVRQIRAGKFEAELVEGRTELLAGPLRDGFAGEQLPGTVALPRDRSYHGAGLVLTVAVSREPVWATLRQLATALVGVSLVMWLTAAVWGRWLCRRALRPIAEMATSARSIRHHPDAGAFLDVSPSGDELEDLGRAFNELLAGLRESLERQRRFTGDASHQLRTPLTAMLGQVEVALRKERTPAEYQRVLTILRQRGEQLHRIIESLLFLARAEAEAPVPNIAVFDLGEWCRSWLEGWQQHSRNGDIEVRCGTRPVWARTQPALLGQVLDNLLDNACKYSEAGTPVVIAVEGREGEAVLSVTDRGCGIEADEQALIMQPFYRSHDARRLGKPGLGLGLTVAERLVSLMGGRLEVSSESGQGSTFRVILPAPGEDALTTRHEPAGQPAHPAAAGAVRHEENQANLI